jgi:hypothetical protein
MSILTGSVEQKAELCFGCRPKLIVGDGHQVMISLSEVETLRQLWDIDYL